MLKTILKIVSVLLIVALISFHTLSPQFLYVNATEPETNDPKVPENLICLSKTDTSLTLSWSTPSDSSGLTGYIIYEISDNHQIIAETGIENTCEINDLIPDTVYTFTVNAVYGDIISNESNIVTVVLNPDIGAPSTPTGLKLISKSNNSLTYTWEPSEDNAWVAGYEIYRNGIRIGTSDKSIYTDSGLYAATAYEYSVRSFDIAGNISEASDVLNIVTNDDDHGDDIISATFLEIGIEQTGTIETAGDIDFYQFRTSTTGEYIIKSMGNTDCYGCLYEEEGILITENNDKDSLDTNFFMSTTLQANKVYFVKIMHCMPAGIGDYTFDVSLTSLNPDPTNEYGGNLPLSTSGNKVFEIDGKLYSVGGVNYTTIGIQKIVNEYNPITDEFIEKTGRMIDTRWGFGAAVANNKIYVVGGANTGSLNTVESYSPVTDEWILESSMTTARAGAAVVELAGKLYIINGVNESGYLNSVEVYDPNNIEVPWSTVNNTNISRAWASVVAVNGKIYLIGGQNDSEDYLSSVEVYDPAIGQWALIENSMPTERTGCEAVAMNGKIFVIGGYNGEYLNTMEILDTGNQRWSIVPGLSDSRAYFGACSYNNNIYVMGGKNRSSYLSSTEIYQGEYAEWLPARYIRGNISQQYYGGGSYAFRSDGKVLVTYEKERDIYLSVVDSEDDLFEQSNICSVSEWVYYSRYSTQVALRTNSMLQKLDNGKILLYINEHGVYGQEDKPNKVMVYESSNGLGTDFTLKSVVREFSVKNYSVCLYDSSITLGQPIQLETGRILIPFSGMAPYSGTTGKMALFCGYSDDYGETWSVSVVRNSIPYYEDIRGIGRAGDQLFILAHDFLGLGSSWFMYSNNNGESWISYSTYYQQKTNFDLLKSHVFWGNGDGYTYMLYQNGGFNDRYWIYRHNDNISINFTGQIPYEMGPIGSGATWEGPLRPVDMGDDYTERLFVSESGNMSVLGTSIYAVTGSSYLYGCKRRILSKP